MLPVESNMEEGVEEEGVRSMGVLVMFMVMFGGGGEERMEKDGGKSKWRR